MSTKKASEVVGWLSTNGPYTVIDWQARCLKAEEREKKLFAYYDRTQNAAGLGLPSSDLSGIESDRDELVKSLAELAAIKRDGPWHVGSKVPLNVYFDGRPFCQCHTPEDAAMLVAKMNELAEIGELQAAEGLTVPQEED